MKKFYPPDGQHFCFAMTDGASAPPIIEGNHTVLEYPENGKTPNERGRIVNFLTEPTVIITSCPIIVSDFDKSCVLLVYSNGELSAPDIQTFGASVNFIAKRLFSRQKTTGDVSALAFDQWRVKLKRARTTDRVDAIEAQFYKAMGESAETILLFNAATMRKRDLEKK